MQPDLVFSSERDGVRRPSEAVTGRNAMLLRLGLAEDVCRDVLNPGEHPRAHLRVRYRIVGFCAPVALNTSAAIDCRSYSSAVRILATDASA